MSAILVSFRSMAVAALLISMIAELYGEGFRPDRLILTWQQDPSTTMTVQWLQSGKELPQAEGSGSEPVIHNIPRTGEVEIDAQPKSWWEEATRLAYLADDSHELQESFGAKARLAWNDDGLLVVVEVVDPTPGESANPDRIWDGDSVEILVSDGVGSTYRYHVVMVPGRETEIDPHFYEKRGGPAVDQLNVEYAVRVVEDGYVMEVLLPWSNLPQTSVAEGQQLAVQIYVNSRPGAQGDFTWVGLHPSRDGGSNPDSMFAFQLGLEASPPLTLRSTVERHGEAEAILFVRGRPELTGQTVEIRSGQHLIGEADLEARGEVAGAEIPLENPPEGTRWGRFEVSLDGTPVAALNSPGWQQFGPPSPATLHYWVQAEGRESAAEVETEVRGIDRWPGKFRQRVELSGLQPDSHYRFQAKDHDEDYGFRTMPERLTRPVRFATGGDTRHRQEWMEKTNRVALAYDLDFVAWGGDLAYADGREDRLNRWEEWFEANYNGLIDEGNRVIPILVGIGNHEVQGGYYFRHDGFETTDEWRLRIAPYFYQFFAFPGQPGYGVLDFGDYLSLIFLDSAHSNPVEGEQTEWLERVLAERTGRAHLIPIYHVPAYPSHRSFSGRVETAVRETWTPLFDEYGVRVAFENHDHTYKRTHAIRGGELHPDGVVYFGDGAWGVGVREGSSRDEWYIDQFASERHAIIVTLDGEEMEIIVANEDGKVIDRFPAE